jgi:hypothetical protein
LRVSPKKQYTVKPLHCKEGMPLEHSIAQP